MPNAPSPRADAILSTFPSRVRIVEVGPRDGLQNLSTIVSTADKVAYIRLLAESGLQDIEAGSFVNPERVPQMADSGEVFAALMADPSRDLRYSALVPNRRGLDRAIAAGVRAIALFTAASETFNRRNVGVPVSESLAEFQAMMPAARENGLWVRAYISTAFVCPYEGRIPPDQVVPVADRLLEMGVDEISIGDTLGHATPDQVARLTDALLPLLPVSRFAYHFHDTLGFALANVLMALPYGIHIFDSSAGGVGGCPFAPGAAGNVATEDLLALLHGMGIETGVDVERVAAASRFLQSARPTAT